MLFLRSCFPLLSEAASLSSGHCQKGVGMLKLWMPHPWRHSRPGWMWLWAAWSAGWRPCTEQGGWNEMSIVVLFNPGHSVIQAALHAF